MLFKKKLIKVYYILMTFITSVRNTTSTLNSTTTTLAGNATFTGSYENIEKYASATINIIADQTGAVLIDCSSDGVNLDKSEYFKYEDVNERLDLTSVFTSKYFRIRYMNDASAQGTFRLQTIYRTESGSQLTPAIRNGGVSLPLTNYDEFFRIKTAQPQTLFDSNFTQTDQRFLWDTFASGTATLNHMVPESYYKLETGSSGTAIHQTREYFTYQPGKSFEILITGTLTVTSASGTISRIGIFDDNAQKTVGLTTIGDGFFFQLTNTTLAVVKRSSASGTQVDTVINQDDWNVDRLDGMGQSRITINPNYRQIFFFSQEWLGVGSVTMGIVVDRQIIPCHVWEHANKINNGDNPTLPYTTRASLPLRYEISASSTASTMIQVCSSVVSNGGFQPLGRFDFSVNTGAARLIDNNGEEALLSIRLKETGNLNRVTVVPKNIQVGITTNDVIIYRIYRIYSPGTDPIGATPSTWTSGDDPASPSNSAVEYNDEADNKISASDFQTAGYTFNLIQSGQLFNQSRGIDLTDVNLTLNSNIAGETDYIVITVERTSGNVDVLAAISWSELY